MRRNGLSSVIVLVSLMALASCGVGDARSSGASSGCGASSGRPGALTTFEPSTGDEIWTKCIGASQVVAATDTTAVVYDEAGSFQSIDLATGALGWRVNLPHPNEPPIVRTSSSPSVLRAGSVLVALMNSNPNRIVGLDAATGRQLWEVATPTDARMPILELVDDDLLIVRDNVVQAVPRGVEPSFNRPILMYLEPATGEPAEPAVIAPSTTQSNEFGELRVEQVIDDNAQRLVLFGRRTPGPLLWSKEVPGMVARLVGRQILVIDQTGGTGVYGPSTGMTVDTRVTAYDLITGEQGWQIALPGTPQQVFPVSGGIAVADGSEVRLLDPATGATLWTADHGSPGRGGEFSEPGFYREFIGGGEGTPIAGLIVAEKPYRD
jgi:outer membrane protein assembly factor BamB